MMIMMHSVTDADPIEYKKRSYFVTIDAAITMITFLGICLFFFGKTKCQRWAILLPVARYMDTNQSHV